jgi:hypothetical protein
MLVTPFRVTRYFWFDWRHETRFMKGSIRFTSGRIFCFNWSFDSQRLFLTRGDVTRDVVLFSNLR